MKTHPNANTAWILALKRVVEEGETIAPRGHVTKELLGMATRFDMHYPVVTILHRNISHRFMAAEAHWILTGDNRVSTIAPYAPSIRQFSDDGETFFGAYGPRIKDQLDEAVEALLRDPATRQSVITIWRPNPPATRDVPCTVAVQFLLRENPAKPGEYQLHCVDTMRSSDLWLGWVYDVFNFTALSAVVALKLRGEGVQCDLGFLHLQAGSQHLYERNFARVAQVLAEPDGRLYNKLDLNRFGSASAFVRHLREFAEGSSNSAELGMFLSDLGA